MAVGLGDAEGRITVDTSQAQSAIGQLGSTLSGLDAKTSIGQGIATFNQSIVGLAQGMQNIGRVSLGLGAAISAPFIAAGKSALDFEQQMANVNAVMDLSGDQFTKLGELAQQLGKDTVFTGTEVGQGIEVMAKAGVEFEDIVGGAAEAATDLAAAAGTSVPEAADVMTAAINAFSLAGTDATHVADVLAGAANASLADLSDLGLGFAQVAGFAAELGVPLEELATQLSIMTDKGLSGSDAATSLKNALASAIAPIGMAAKEQERLGISFANSEGEFIGIKSAAELLMNTYDEMGLSQEEVQESLVKLFGRDGFRALLFAMQEVEDEQNGGTKGWDEYERAVNDAGAAQRIAEERMDSTQGAIERLTGSLDVLAAKAGEGLVKGLRGPIEGLVELVNTLTELPAPLLQAITIIGAATGAAIALGGAFLLTGGYILEAVARLGAAGVTIDGVIGAVLRLTTAMTALGLAIGIGVLAFQNNFLGIRDLVNGIVDGLGDFVDNARKAATGAANSGRDYGVLEQALIGLGSALVKTGVPAFRDFGLSVLEAAEGIFQARKVYTDLTKKGIAPLVAGLRAGAAFFDEWIGGFGPSGIGGALDAAADKLQLFGDTFAEVREGAGAAGLSGLAADVQALGVALDTAFGTNVSDTLNDIAIAAQHATDRFQEFLTIGLNPLEAGIRAVSGFFRELGFDAIADALSHVAARMQEVGNLFGSIFQLGQTANINGLSSALLGLGAAINNITGSGAGSFFVRLGLVIDAFAKAASNAIIEGANPLQAAIIGLDTALDAMLSPEAEAFLDTISLSMQGLADSVGNALGAGLNRIGQMFDEIGTALSQGDISGAITAVQSALTDLGSQIDLAEMAQGVADKITEALGTVGDLLGPVAQTVATAIKGRMEAVGSFVGDVDWGKVKLTLGQHLTAALATIGDTIGPIAQTVANAIKAKLGETAGLIGDVNWDAVKNALGTSLSNAIAGIGDTLGPIAGNIVTAIRDKLGEIGTQIGTIDWTAVKNAIGTSLSNALAEIGNNIGPIAGNVATAIRDKLAEVGNALGTIDWESVRTAIGNSLSNALSNLGANLGPIAGNIVTAIKDSIGNIGSVLGTFDWSALVSGVTSSINTALTGLKVSLGIPDFQWEDLGAVIKAINAPLEQIKVDPSMVANATAKGTEIGREISAALSKGITAAIASMNADIAGSAAKGADAGPGGAGELTQIAQTHGGDVAGGFARGFLQGFGEEIGPAMAGAVPAMINALGVAIRGAVADAVIGLAKLPAENFQAAVEVGKNAAQTVVDAWQKGFTGEQPKAESDAKAAGGEAGKGVSDAYIDEAGFSLTTGLKGAAGKSTMDIFGGALQTFWRGLPFAGISDVAKAAGVEAAEDQGGAMTEGFKSELPKQIGEGINEAAPEAEAAAGEAAGNIQINEQIENALLTNIGGITLGEFARQIGLKINEAIQLGLAQTGGAAVPGSTGTTPVVTIGESIASTLADSISGADFSAVGTAIQTKISEAVTSGLSGTPQAGFGGTGATGVGSDIGTTVASSLADSITQADFTLVGTAIQTKISEALSAGLSEESAGAGQAVGASGTGIGASVAASMASAITNADFTAVGDAITSKISQAVSAGTSGAGAAAGGRPGGAAGSGVDIGSSIASSIAGQVSGADFSAVGAAISAGIAESLGTNTAAIQQALAAVIGAVVDSGSNNAQAAQAVGTSLTNAVGSGIGQGASTPITAMQTVVTTAISVAQGVANGAGIIGTDMTTATGTGIGAGASTVISAIQAVMTSAISAGQGTADTANVIGTSMTTAVGSGIGAGTGTIISAIQAAVASAIAAGNADAFGQAQAIGVSIAEGIAAGVGAGTGAITSAVQAAVAAGVAAAGQAIESGSPSKLFAREVGLPMAQGVAVGIEEGTDDIEQASAKMVRGAAKGADGVGEGLESLRELADRFRDLPGFSEFSNQIDTIADSLQEQTQKIQDRAQEMIDKLRQKLKDGAKGAKEDATNLGKSVSDGLAEGSAGGGIDKGTVKDSQKSIVGDLSAMKGDVDDLRALADRLRDLPGFAEISAMMDQIANNIDQKRGDALGKAKDFFKQMEQNIKEASKATKKASEDVGTSVPSGIQEGMSSGAGATESTTQQLISSIEGSLNANLGRLPEMAEAIGSDVGQGLADGLQSQQLPVFDNARALGEVTEDGLTQRIPNVEAAGTELVTAATDSMTSASGEAASFSEQIGQLISDSFGEGFAAGGDPQAAIDLVNKFHQGLTETINSILPQTKADGAAVGDALNQGIDSVDATGAGASLANEAANGLKSNLAPVKGAASDVGSQIGTSLNNSIQDACAPVNSSAEDITSDCVPSGLQAGSATAEKAATDAGSDISDSLLDGLEVKKKDITKGFGEAGGIFGKGMASGIGDTAQESINAARAAAQRAGSESKTTASTGGKDVGRAIGQGIADGVTSTIPAIRDAVEKAVQEGIDAAKEKSKSESPSRVFMDIGRDWMLGAAIGVDQGTDKMLQEVNRSVGLAADMFSGSALLQATRAFNRDMDRYTDQVVDGLTDIGKIILGTGGRPTIPIQIDRATIPRSQLPVQSSSGDTFITNINGINVKETQPEAVATRQFVSSLERIGGQYVRRTK